MPKNVKAVIEDRRERVAELFGAGLRPKEIAEELVKANIPGASLRQVEKDLNYIVRHHEKEMPENMRLKILKTELMYEEAIQRLWKLANVPDSDTRIKSLNILVNTLNKRMEIWAKLGWLKAPEVEGGNNKIDVTNFFKRFNIQLVGDEQSNFGPTVHVSTGGENNQSEEKTD